MDFFLLVAEEAKNFGLIDAILERRPVPASDKTDSQSDTDKKDTK